MSNSFININNNQSLSCTLSSYGAGVRKLLFNNLDVILNFSSDIDYLNSDMFFGKTLGRVGGRIPSSFTLSDIKYNLKEDEKNISLHGGKLNSLSFKDFNYQIKEEKNQKTVSFNYLSKDKEEGFPGILEIEINYVFSLLENEMDIVYKAHSDIDTIISLSNHMYFNFSENDVNDHYLFIDSDNIATFKKNTLLINGKEKITDDFSFNQLTKLKNKLDIIEKKHNFLDNYFLFNNNDINKPKIILQNKKIIMEIYTSYEGCNVYVDSTRRNLDFNNNKLNQQIRRGIAIECEKMNYPIDNLLLKKGETYSHFIKYKFRSNDA